MTGTAYEQYMPQFSCAAESAHLISFLFGHFATRRDRIVSKGKVANPCRSENPLLVWLRL